MNGRYSHLKKRRGLTLIELLVVLTIITAVATILIPVMPNANQMSGGSTGSGNMREVIKTVEIHRSITGNYANSWDSLIDEDGDILPTPNGGPDLEILDLTGAAVGSDEALVASALARAGINQTLQHNDFDGTNNQTFDATNGIDELTDNENVAVLALAGEDSLGLIPSNLVGGDVVRYVAFGLGDNSTMIGRSMADAPVRFLGGGENPTTQYARWIVVFTVFEDETLRLATIAGLDDDRLQGINFHVNDFYDAF